MRASTPPVTGGLPSARERYAARCAASPTPKADGSSGSSDAERRCARALNDRKHRRQHEQSRDAWRASKSTDDRTAQRRRLLAALTKAERQRQHARDHREARHQDRTQPTRGAVDGSDDRVVPAETATLGECHEQNRVGHRHADGHDRAHERLNVQRRPREPQREHALRRSPPVSSTRR